MCNESLSLGYSSCEVNLKSELLLSYIQINLIDDEENISILKSAIRDSSISFIELDYDSFLLVIKFSDL